ncbi:hypothetical protein GCM10011340_30660 [Roseivirga thermotolerans]|uniref:RHS repeat-associated core domain-containing protein n=1 Tax=Roseivirga thermotolerans TaxID=1758176 RepID=A0ABQ3IBK5_9BACT|nr:hypothetical protein GCM10011340_30660 [Roseivirga thermotolerans]
MSSSAPLSKPNNYKFNGKEIQEEFDINIYDYGARNYDAALGRWFNVDPLADLYLETSPYGFVKNNPLVNREIDGRYFDEKNEKTAAKMERRAEKQASKLERKADKREAKGKDVGDLRERASELRQTAGDIVDMRGSTTEFRFAKSSDKSNTVRDGNGNGLPVTYRTGENQITMFMDKKTNFHEPRHGGQIARGEYDIDQQGNISSGYGASHEISAYRAQYALRGKLIYGVGIDLDQVGTLLQMAQGVNVPKRTMSSISGINMDFLRNLVDQPGLNQKYVYRDYPASWWDN